MKPTLLKLAAFLSAAAASQAHFVWAVPEPGGTTAKIFISEELKPDGAVDFTLVARAKLILRGADRKEIPLTLVKGQGAFTVSLSGTGSRVIHGVDDLGLSQSSPDKPFLLLYHPKTILGDAFDAKSAVGADATVELIPHGKPGALALEFVAHGKPQANAEVTVLLPDGTQKKVKTDVEGKTETFAAMGRYGAWARFWEPGSGESAGKKYKEVHHYATLVFDVNGDVKGDVTGSAITAKRFAKLPEATSAFGSVTSDGWLYIYGGHVSPTHTYSTAAVSGKFYRLNLAKPDKWETLPGGQGLQGMNLAAYDGKIYLVGGMSPQNKPGAPSDTRSVADCARFEPATRKWEPLPPLPEGRSSHDVVVIDGKLIVTGGWNLQGKEEDWAETVAVLDLKAPKLAWASFKQPFKRRALMAAAYMGKMYVIGGMSESDNIMHDVSIYDPKTDTWSDGPKLPPGDTLGFAPAVAVHQGRLYVGVADGTLLRLSSSGDKWENAGHSTPRLAHRLASAPNAVLVIGVANGGKNSDLVESILVENEPLH